MGSDNLTEALWTTLNVVIFCSAVMLGFTQIGQEQRLTASLSRSMQVHETSTVVHGTSDHWNQWNGSDYSQTYYDINQNEVLSMIYNSTSSTKIQIDDVDIDETELNNFRECYSENFKNYIPSGNYKYILTFDTDGNCTSINFVHD